MNERMNHGLEKNRENKWMGMQVKEKIYKTKKDVEKCTNETDNVLK